MEIDTSAALSINPDVSNWFDSGLFQSRVHHGGEKSILDRSGILYYFFGK
jgi:hypothetical protein